MRFASALELKNSIKSEAPVIVVAAAPGQPIADLERWLVAAAAGRAEVLGVSASDADPEVARFLDEAGVELLPGVLVYARGVLLERSHVVRDARAAHALVALLPGPAGGRP